MALLSIPYLLHNTTAPDFLAVNPLMGEPAPAVAGATADGRALDLASFHGRWVLVNFFATRCSACRAELSQLVALAA